MKKRLIMAVAVIVLAATAFAMYPKPQNPAPAPSADAVAQDSDAPETMAFDNYGRTVTVTGVPQRVLTLGPNCSELFVALGLGDKIAGNTLDNHSRGPLPEYADIYNTIPELNYGSATREAVIGSDADFIYGLDWEFGDAGLDIKELENSGMIVYTNSASSLEQIYGEIRDIGRIFRIEASADQFIKNQKSRIAAVAEKTSAREPVKVLIYDSGNDGVFTCSGTNFESMLVEQAGGQNIFADLKDKQWVTVTYEEVLKRNPDCIVVHDYDSPSVEEKIAQIKANSAMSQLDCVKNNRFVIIELESVLPGNRMAHSVEKLAKGFYPDMFR